MSHFFRKSMKALSMNRLRSIASTAHRNVCVSPRMQLYQQVTSNKINKNFVTAATEYKMQDDSFANNDRRSMEEILIDIDWIVRRTGRTTSKKVYAALTCMREEGKCSSTHALFLIRSCGLVRDNTPQDIIKLSSDVWNELQTLPDCKFNVQHYNALLKIYVSKGHNISPDSFLASMKDLNIEPDKLTFQLLIDKHCMDGNLEGASEMLETMKKQGIPINEVIFHSLIKGHIAVDDVEGAKNLLEVMKASNLSPTSDTYLAFVTSFAKKGNIEGLKSAMSEASDKGLVFTTPHQLAIISALAPGRHVEVIEEILQSIKISEEWKPDFLNTAIDLVHEGLDELAFKLASSTSDGKIVTIFIKQMIKCGRAIEKIMPYCDDIFAKGLNDYVYYQSARTAVELEKYDHAFAFFGAMQNQGIPVRINLLRPLFNQVQNSPDGIWAILKGMSRLGIPADYKTFLHDVYPVCAMPKPEELFAKVEEAGHSARSCIDPLFEYYCLKRNVSEAYYLLKNFKVNVPETFRIDDFLSLYEDYESNPTLYFKVLHFILENIGNNDAVVQGCKIAQFLEINVNLFNNFHKEVNYQCKYDEQAIYVCREILTEKRSRLLGHFERMVDNFYKRGGSTALEAKRSKEFQSRDGLSPPSSAPSQLSMAIKMKDSQKVNALLSESEASGVQLPARIMAQLFSLFCNNDDIENAEKYLKRLQEIYPDFTLDSSKIFNYALLLVKLRKYDEVKKLLEEHCKELFIVNQDIAGKNMKRLIMAVVETADQELVKSVHASLMKHEKSFENPIVLFEPLVQVYVYQNNVEAAVNEFVKCCRLYKNPPLIKLLMRKCISMDHSDLLKVVVDSASSCIGSSKVMLELVCAFIESGLPLQAVKVLQGLGNKVDTAFLDGIAHGFYQTNSITMLEQLYLVVKGSGNDPNNIVKYLAQSYAAKNDYQKAAELCRNLQNENIALSLETKQVLRTLFEQNGQPVPFEMAEANGTSAADVDSIPIVSTFMNYLSEEDARQTLTTLQGMKKGIVRSLSFKTMTEFVDLLIRKEHVKDLMLNVNVMSYIIENSSEILKPLLELYSSTGDIEATHAVASFMPDFSLRKCSYNSFLAKAYIAANKQEELLSLLESRWDKRSKLFSMNAMEALLNSELLEAQTIKLAEKYMQDNFELPISMVWAHYIINGKYPLAEDLSKRFTIAAEKVDHTILRVIRQEENVNMGLAYIKLAGDSSLKSRCSERAYGTVLDVLITKELYSEAEKLIAETQEKHVSLDKDYKAIIKNQGKPVHNEMEYNAA